MSETAAKPEAATTGELPSSGEGAPATTPSLARVWQVPVTLAGVGLLIAGVVIAFLRAPKPDHSGVLHEAQTLLASQKYAEALGSINTNVLPLVAKGALSPQQLAEMSLLTARAVALGQRELGVNRRENNSAIVEHYSKAEAGHIPLDARDESLRTEAMIGLEMFKEAESRVPKIADAPTRERLTRSLIEALTSAKRHSDAMAWLTRTSTDPSTSEPLRWWCVGQQAMVLLSQGFHEEAITRLLRAMPRLDGIPPHDAAPLYMMLARAYAETGDTEQALSQLVRVEAILSPDDPLMPRVLLAQGRLAQEHDRERARERYRSLLERFKGVPEHPAALLGLADVDAADGHHDSAIANYQELLAIVGRSDSPSEAPHGASSEHGRVADGAHSSSDSKSSSAADDAHATPANAEKHAEVTEVEHPGGKVEYLRDDGTKADSHGDPHATGESDAHSASEPSHTDTKHASESHAKASHASSSHAASGHASDSYTSHGSSSASESLLWPTVTLGTIESSAMSHYRDRFDAEDYGNALRYVEVARRAGQMRGEVGLDVLAAVGQVNRLLGEQTLKDSGGEALTVATADPVTQAQAKEHFLASGRAFKEHARRTLVKNLGAHASSLWASGEVYDLAGDSDEAMAAFRQFLSEFPIDPKTPEAKYRLAIMAMARGELNDAQRLFRELIAGRGAAQSSGPFADMSLIPLARALLSDTSTDNDSEAERLLVRVVSGEAGGPGTEVFRQGLLEFAGYLYQSKRYAEAIARFTEIIERYSGEDRGDGSIDSARYMLADAHRLEAERLAVELKNPAITQTARRASENERHAHLVAAQDAFELAKKGLAELRSRNQLRDRQLRNCYFYLGEVAFDLEDFEGSIRAYDEARERYSRDPSALVAMIQIVAAHQARGELDQARAAHARAKKFFESLPDSVWDDPTLPMDRRAWERWLAVSATLVGPGPGATREAAHDEPDEHE
ncbi:MAG: tetratricopeptide repeat protein [Phycisphaerales bacterium]|nr:MAG: tetratricopeptide repeat protein [Phycisphaerales bacterium]